MKTPEQSLNEFIEFYVNRIDRSEDGLVEECLKDGAKWQAKQMYSEEEVLHIIDSFEKLCYNYQSNKDWFPSKKSEWFKQFKK
jgi:RNA-splicing ligase RtcB